MSHVTPRPFRLWWLSATLGLVLMSVLVAAIMAWQRDQAARRAHQQETQYAEGAVLAQACLAFLQERFGNTPPLSQVEARRWAWDKTLPNRHQLWNMDGTVLYGRELAAFDCEGIKRPDGVVQVQEAYGTPWWTPPPD